MEGHNLQKAGVIILLFVLAFSYFGLQFAGGGDYEFHYEKSLNGCSQEDEACQKYAPLFHWIAGPFTFHEKAFYYFVLFLLAIVIPFLLFLIARHWLVVWLYFSTTSFYWFFIDGLFAQAVALILFLLVFVVKDWRLRGAILVLSIFSHGHGFFLVLIALIAIYLWQIIEPFLERRRILKEVFGFFPCSGVFGVNKPEVLSQPVGDLTTTGVSFTVADALIPFTKIFPFPYFLLALKELWDSKQNWHYLLLFPVILVAGFWVSHRIFYVLPLVLLHPLTDFAVRLVGWKKGLFFLSTLLVFGFQLYSWLNRKLVCAG